MPQSRYKLFRGPSSYLVRRRKLRGIDIDDSGIRSAKLVAMRVSFGINIFCEIEPFPARLRKSDQFFQPVRASCLQVDTSVEALQDLVDGSIERKLVAPGMYARFRFAGSPYL